MAFARPSSSIDLSQSPMQQKMAVPASGPVAHLGDLGRSTFEPAKSQELATSVIGTDLTILGDSITIISQNRLQIDGDIRGDVSGKQVTIGSAGSVTGTVSAEQIEVLGGVQGAIRARSVVLHPSSRVDGEIVHETLSISEGAQFDGRVRRSRDVSELAPNLDPSTFPSHKPRDTQS